MLVALWSIGLLISFFTFCASLEEECVLGVVGHPVLLPCYHYEPLSFHNLSVEWRRNNELVLKAEWEEDEDVVIWSLNCATIRANAPQTGNFSLELPKVSTKEDNMRYSLFFTSSENGSVPLCSTCLRTAGLTVNYSLCQSHAWINGEGYVIQINCTLRGGWFALAMQERKTRFSSPLLKKNQLSDGNKTVFTCQSSGGFPEPTVYWLINDTDQPPEGSVQTNAATVPESNLYNVTSLLTVNISRTDSVSCAIENEWMNEILTSKSSGPKDDTFRSRASEGMWMFSTGLCVAVGILVGVGVGYQIHLDRISKKRRAQYESTQRGHKKRPQILQETEGDILMSKETCV